MKIVVAMTGASGAAFAARLLDVLDQQQHDVHLIISESAGLVFQEELGLRIDVRQLDPCEFVLQCRRALEPWGGTQTSSIQLQPPQLQPRGTLRYYQANDFMAPIASGSYLTDGMVVCPCSGGTLSSIVHGLGNNLIHRAADVHLKERRRLIVVPRETPLSAIQLENMRRLAEAGAVVMPAMPGWYHGVRGVMDLIDFMVARILDQLEIPHELVRRWGTQMELS
ncbi:MAG: UbiX family flavin prenyltransferase [Planctomycetota bacterium]|nr:UbiX family flavin prenyltransferase [Planctomycetota bacterium]MDA1179173.1 UbiX family flavin prenyltransferase [Planctomycetota bacterium]